MEYKDEGVNAICHITTFRLLGQFYLLYSNSLPTSYTKVKQAFWMIILKTVLRGEGETDYKMTSNSLLKRG